MKSVDTNVVLRFLLGDDAKQTAIADKIMASDVSVPLTVLLEVGWVLASRYGFERNQLSQMLIQLVDRPLIHFADRASVRAALLLFAQGTDFADAIHLVASRGTESFVTFDRGINGSELIGVPVELAA